VQRDNAFIALDDLGRTQRLADAQARAPLVRVMEKLLAQCHPLATELWPAHSGSRIIGASINRSMRRT